MKVLTPQLLPVELPSVRLLKGLRSVSCVGTSRAAEGQIANAALEHDGSHLSHPVGSVSAATFRQDAAGLGELGRGDVEEGGARN